MYIYVHQMLIMQNSSIWYSLMTCLGSDNLGKLYFATNNKITFKPQ